MSKRINSTKPSDYKPCIDYTRNGNVMLNDNIVVFKTIYKTRNIKGELKTTETTLYNLLTPDGKLLFDFDLYTAPEKVHPFDKISHLCWSKDTKESFILFNDVNGDLVCDRPLSEIDGNKATGKYFDCIIGHEETDLKDKKTYYRYKHYSIVRDTNGLYNYIRMDGHTISDIWFLDTGMLESIEKMPMIPVKYINNGHIYYNVLHYDGHFEFPIENNFFKDCKSIKNIRIDYYWKNILCIYTSYTKIYNILTNEIYSLALKLHPFGTMTFEIDDNDDKDNNIVDFEGFIIEQSFFSPMHQYNKDRCDKKNQEIEKLYDNLSDYDYPNRIHLDGSLIDLTKN